MPRMLLYRNVHNEEMEMDTAFTVEFHMDTDRLMLGDQMNHRHCKLKDDTTLSKCQTV